MKKHTLVLVALFFFFLLQISVYGKTEIDGDSLVKENVASRQAGIFPDSSAWILTKIVGVKSKKMTIGAKAFIIINKKTLKLMGYTSCNFLIGAVSFQDSTGIGFSAFSPLKRSCDTKTDKLEVLFRETLSKTTSWKIENNLLFLYANGAVILEFIEVPSPKK